MTIQKLIDTTSPPLRQDDMVEHALGLMMELRVRHLPVVAETGHLIGMLSEDQLLEALGPRTPVERLIRAEPVSLHPNIHIFDATKLIVQHDLTTIPVVDGENTYVGLLRRQDLFERFAEMLRTEAPGAILALEVEPHDYSLSQLVYTVEQHDVKILSISSETADDPTETIRITLKLNAQDTARIRHVLEHHGYRVVAAFSEEEDQTDLHHRVEEFMRYLEV